MEEISLFPLHTVLFPTNPLPLHIFEARYRALIQRCLMEEVPFGVVLIRQGDEAGGPLAEPYPVGCVTRIKRVERLPDGRLNLLTTGSERFRIQQLIPHQPYLRAEVEIMPFEPAAAGELEQLARGLWQLLAAYVERVQSEPSPQTLQYLRQYGLVDPRSAFFLAAMLLEVPPFEKQRLLEIPSTAGLAGEVLRLYRRELGLQAASLKDRRRGAFGARWGN